MKFPSVSSNIMLFYVSKGETIDLGLLEAQILITDFVSGTNPDNRSMPKEIIAVIFPPPSNLTVKWGSFVPCSSDGGISKMLLFLCILSDVLQRFL